MTGLFDLRRARVRGPGTRLRALRGFVASSVVVAAAIATAGAAHSGSAETVVPTDVTLASFATVPAATDYTLRLGSLPALATSVTVAVNARAVGGATKLSLCAGAFSTHECADHPQISVAAGQSAAGLVKLALAGAENELTLRSSDAPVSVTLSLTAYTIPTAVATPSPTTLRPTAGGASAMSSGSDVSSMATDGGMPTEVPSSTPSSASASSGTSSAAATPSAVTTGPSAAATSTTQPASPSPAGNATAPSSPAVPVSATVPPAGPTTDKAHWIPPMVTNLAGFPGPSNTGVPNGTALTVWNGDMTVTTPGAHIDGLEIRGYVSIKAANVLITNCRIVGSGSAPAYTRGLVQVSSASTSYSVTVQDSELYAAVPSPYVNGAMGSNMTLTRVNIHDVIDSVHVTGDDVTVQDSWLHNNLHYVNDPTQGNTPSHDDSVQVQIGQNIKLLHDTIQGSHSAGLMITQGTGRVSSVTVKGNFIDNGACSINLSEGHSGPIQGMSITDNVFGGHTWNPNCAIISPPTTTSLLTLSANIYLEGEPVAVSSGA